MRGLKFSFIILISISYGAFGQDLQVKEERKALGKALGPTLNVETSGRGVSGEAQSTRSEARLRVLGKSISYLKSELTVADETTAEVKTYAFGKRISGVLEIGNEGLLKWKAVLPPIEYKITPLVYPVGPVLLQVDAGVRGQGELSAEIQPTLILPIEQSIVDVIIGLDAEADAFVEGSGKLLVFKAGIGGEMQIIRANASLRGSFSFLGEAPVVTYGGELHAFEGAFFAFLDIFNFFGFRYKRLWRKNLFDWRGICKSFSSTDGNETCPN